VAGRKRWNAALISGGGSGIGLRLTELLLERGTNVAVLDLTIRREVREQLDKRTATGSAMCSFHEANVCDAAALDGAARDAVHAVGPLDLAINSAGIQICKTFDEITSEEFARVVDVNLVGSRNFAAAVLPQMGPGSRLALIASLAGFVANYGYAAYNASKFGVVGLAGALRLESRPRGIGVSVVCPPEVETPMVEAERASGDPISLKMKEFSGTLALDDACRDILSGLDAGRAVIIPGRRARMTQRLARFVPGLLNAISDRMIRRALP